MKKAHLYNPSVQVGLCRVAA